MTPMYLSRARLRSDQALRALSQLLVTREGLTPHAGKALIWSLFADSDDRRRDFLWRWDGQRAGRLAGEFLILSTRRPQDAHSFFELETKDFAPSLTPGDRLTFRLRANPVVRVRAEGKPRPTKHDVVMHSLRTHPTGARADVRDRLVAEQGLAWIERQLSNAGATLVPGGIRIDGYSMHEVPDGRRAKIQFSSLDFDGALRVNDPTRFLAALRDGFGASKAYGFGLMLIKRG